jgi:hypothetical protein
MLNGIDATRSSLQADGKAKHSLTLAIGKYLYSIKLFTSARRNIDELVRFLLDTLYIDIHNMLELPLWEFLLRHALF